jgi:acetyl-CoA carboxylase biotin carboxyl carrier protein
LVKLMNENDLAEIDLRNAAQRLRLRKRGNELVPVLAAAPPPSQPTQAPPAPAPPTPKAPAEPVEQEFPGIEIKSPMLGTFYRASSPDAEPFVQLGSHVEPDTIICVIEAMKVFNEIAAEARGKITAILVENGQPVEYSQAMFRIDPTG